MIDPVLRLLCSGKELEAHLKVKRETMRIGKLLEDFLDENSDENVTFVGRNRRRPRGVDFIIDGHFWSVKNSYNTENSSSKTFREDRNIKHWFRLNRDGTTNWQNCPIKNLNETDFTEYVTGNRPNTLEDFFS